jgi:hypothetical protein
VAHNVTHNDPDQTAIGVSGELFGEWERSAFEVSRHGGKCNRVGQSSRAEVTE